MNDTSKKVLRYIYNFHLLWCFMNCLNFKKTSLRHLKPSRNTYLNVSKVVECYKALEIPNVTVQKKKNSCWVYFQVCLTQYYFLFLPNEELCFHIYKKFSLTIKFRAQVKNIVFSQEEIVIEENEVSRRSVVEKKKGIMWQWFCHLALSLAPWYRLQFVRLSRARCIREYNATSRNLLHIWRGRPPDH